MAFSASSTSVKAQVTLLTLTQALAMTTDTVLITTAALVGYAIAADKSLATVPLAMRQVATMAATIPASMLMERVGRRGGFLLGTAVGVLGASLSIYSLMLANFGLFTLAMMLLGLANGFVGYYRFAAADIADEAFRSQAISWVIAGGIIAAVLGPWLANGSQGWFDSELYIGAFVAVVALQLLSAVCLLFLNIPHTAKRQMQESVRSLKTIARQPKFWVATVGSTISYGVMAFIMTATPLAMTDHTHSFAQSAAVIQWHVFGMFGLALFTGWLIKRFGVIAIISTGAVLTWAVWRLIWQGRAFGTLRSRCFCSASAGTLCMLAPPRCSLKPMLPLKKPRFRRLTTLLFLALWQQPPFSRAAFFIGSTGTCSIR